MIDAFINLNKPKRITSFDCIRRLRKILGIKKIGHLGTLDPAASGVLPVAAGRATKLISYLQDAQKGYTAEIMLGITTNTDDLDGEIIRRTDPDEFSIETIINSLDAFKGEILQVPPAFSAVKINGKRAYKIAREGKTPELKARKTIVYSIKLISYHHPVIKAHFSVKTGTYIRSIAKDLGESLQCGASLSSLLRTKSGNFNIEESKTFEEIEAAFSQRNLEDAAVSITKAMSIYPCAVVNEEGRTKISHGMPITRLHIEKISQGNEASWKKEKLPVLLMDKNETPLAVASVKKDKEGFLFMEKVLI